MSNLAQLQRDLQAHVIAQDTAIANSISATDAIPTSTRLQIYSDAYRLRLIEALESNYPVLARSLGARDFSILAQRYLAAFPSRHFSIRWFGDRLFEFALNDAQYAEQQWLQEMIQWEWATALAFDAADVPLLAIDDLARVAPEEWPSLRFEPHPSLRRLSITTNILAIVKASVADEPAPAPMDVREISVAKTEWMIWRESLTVRYRSLDDSEAAALDALLARGTFGEICAALGDHIAAEQIPLQAATYLKSWLVEGCLVKQPST